MKAILKQLSFAILISLITFQEANSASALEGIAKFANKKNAIVSLEIAFTDTEKATGLMNKPSLEKNHGMVFIFRPPKQVTFWMKDTLIPLDMIFINKGKIVKIVKNAEANQTSTLYPSDFPVTEVIEVNGGYADLHKINIGSRVHFENISQIDYSVNSTLMIVPK